MASCEQGKTSENCCEPSGDSDKVEAYECAVCLQKCIQPVRLPCTHVFCYLCVKGAAHQSSRCAMCRQTIPPNYLDNPNLLTDKISSLAFEGTYQWFYSGRNGWWQYDERTSTEIEAAYKQGDKTCEVLIAGFLYVIDFDKFIQARKSDPHRKRQIKRDRISIQKKGIAGIRLPADSKSSNEEDIKSKQPSATDSDCDEEETEDETECSSEDCLHSNGR